MKSKYWTFLMYPDSMPNNWKEIIEKWYIPVAISPIHDKDKKEDGTIKKPHYHAVIYYNNTTTYNQIKRMIEPLGSEYAEPVISFKGMYEYLTHKNNPEKAQYKEEEITKINFKDINDLTGYSESEIEDIKRTIIEIINKNYIYEFKDIYDYCNQNELYQCTNILSHCTIFFEAYLKSKRATSNTSSLAEAPRKHVKCSLE